MRFWFRKPRDVVVPFPPQPVKPMEPIKPLRPKADDGILVEELDSSTVDIQELQTRTGMQRVFDKITGKFK